MLPGTLILCSLLGMASSPATDSLHNDRYTLEAVPGGEIIVRAAGTGAQRLTPEFTVLWSDADPHCARNAGHPNYVVAPRVAVRWRQADEPLNGLNAWLASAEFKAATGLTGIVHAGTTGRWWEFRNGTGHVALRITGKPALDTTRPFSVGHRVVMRPRSIVAGAGRLRVEYPPQDAFALAAEITLPERDDGGDFACVLEVEDVQQKITRSPLIVLPLGPQAGGPVSPPADAGPIVGPPPQSGAAKGPAAALLSADFVGYVQHAANAAGLGLRADGRYYPYSTPQGRRIAWRQPVWDLGLYAHGCTRDEAERHLHDDLARTLDTLKESLAARRPPVDFNRLDRRQQETLLDFAHSEGVAGLRPELVAAVLAGDWSRVISEHLYVRYAGHAPDHPRNKAYLERWPPAQRSVR